MLTLVTLHENLIRIFY